MTAEIHSSPAVHPYPRLQQQMRRLGGVASPRLRVFLQAGLLRLALLWLSASIAWATFRVAVEHGRRRWG